MLKRLYRKLAFVMTLATCSKQWQSKRNVSSSTTKSLKSILSQRQWWARLAWMATVNGRKWKLAASYRKRNTFRSSLFVIDSSDDDDDHFLFSSRGEIMNKIYFCRLIHMQLKIPVSLIFSVFARVPSRRRWESFHLSLLASENKQQSECCGRSCIISAIPSSSFATQSLFTFSETAISFSNISKHINCSFGLRTCN